MGQERRQASARHGVGIAMRERVCGIGMVSNQQGIHSTYVSVCERFSRRLTSARHGRFHEQDPVGQAKTIRNRGKRI